MKAIVYQEYGPAEVLRHTDVDRPAAGDGEVLVRVRAASINHGDLAVMHGSPGILRLAFGLRRPKKTILGRAVAGTVEAVGPKVTGLQVGDEVFGEMNQRGFAEYVAAPEAHLAPKPAEVTFEQAATLPVAATTALQALRLGGAGPGRTVLVNGASGGVGTFAVQLAKTLGAEVTGVCSTRNADLARSIGAHHVIDYTREDLTRGAGRFDVIVDLVGNHQLSGFRRVLAPKGVYVSSSGAGGALLGPLPRLLAAAVTTPFLSQKLRGLVARRSAEDLTLLAGLVAEGKITPVIERTFPLSETADAIRFLEAEHARGKIVLTV
ncbi:MULTISPECIES: NAD(P)-dependent alcohol dehydrogenase [Streptosporangium]|uniref:NADPH:quinone reductase-like Zn-dependent oxidoreductase n=1 Tax=Streptosporangium brasiliense TaxID=47480 RepID=A0ABT9RK13_9ACTN|nr:NAD(P)-dependent alcohol dehydrogenase [Streptosporangium brasiliense]MDP9869595.1 NADPH:quinone reductase-like Zn-dependent oxidoreductase [Streptosporangium brasiliense]